MRILSYSPSVEAYIAASGRDGVVTYYNVTPDIERVSVTTGENRAAECVIKLQNKGDKYTNCFMPMDRVTVYATKRDEHVQLFTGYITSVPKYKIYPDSFEIRCSCMIYRLQHLYWDPNLTASNVLLGYANASSSGEAVLVSLLVNVAHVPAENIVIGGMPEDIIDWARELYAAKQVEVEDMRSKVDAFYQMLSSTNGLIVGEYGNTVASGLAEPLKAGQTLAIPPSIEQTGIIADYTGYNTFYGRWADGTKQKAVSELWAANGKVYRKNIAVIGKYYLVAVRPQFGESGDYIDINLQNGTVIPAIIGDTKGSDALEWGHSYGGKISLVEWEVNEGVFGNDDISEWYGEPVASITNKGSCL